MSEGWGFGCWVRLKKRVFGNLIEMQQMVVVRILVRLVVVARVLLSVGYRSL